MLTEAEAVRLLSGPAPITGTELTDLLGEMLILSGRPWTQDCPGLRQAGLRRADGQIKVQARIGELAVQVLLEALPADAGEPGLRITLEWCNDGDQELTDLAAGLRLPAPAGARVTMPQVIYHDNPSAAAERIVPHVGRGGFVTQEHRLPIPAVCLEWEGETWSLLALPDPAPDPDGSSRYGALGVVADPEQTIIIATSGVIMFDGVPDVDYVHKARTATSTDGYLTLRPGDRVRLRYLLRRGHQQPGRGFQELVQLGTEFFDELNAAPAGHPVLSRTEAIRLKTAALDARSFADGPVAGYLKFPSWGEARETGRYADHGLLYGWTGQSLRLAWCDAVLGLRNDEPGRVQRCRRVVEFYLAGSPTAIPGLRWNAYTHDDRGWTGFPRGGAEMISARAHGETLCDLADIIELFRAAGLAVPVHWVDAVIDGADFVAATALPDGVVPIGWREDGAIADRLSAAAGVPAAHAVAKAHALTGDDHRLRRAKEFADAYQQLVGSRYQRPYAYATLDAACEDKESGLYLLRFLLQLHDLTGDRGHLDRAAEVADWLLSWVYHWSPVHDAGSQLAEQRFQATGWPGVSVQNHHLDVFFPTSDLWRLGRALIGDHPNGQHRSSDQLRGDLYCRWAVRIDAALRQGICTVPGEWGFEVIGEQGEAFFVTDWQQRGTANTWNPSWVIALPLWHALELERLGVLDHIR